MQNKARQILTALAPAFLAIPLVAALPMGKNPLGDALGMLGELLNFTALADNTFAIQGLVRFAMFMVVFAVSNYGFIKVFKGDQNPNGKKTANILSFAFALIATVAVDPRIGDANASLWQGILASFVMMFVFVGGGMYAMFGLRPSDQNDNLGWLYHLIGLVLLLFLFFTLTYWAQYTGVGRLLV